MIRWKDLLHFAYAPLGRRFHLVEGTATVRFDDTALRDAATKRPSSGLRIAHPAWPMFGHPRYLNT